MAVLSTYSSNTSENLIEIIGIEKIKASNIMYFMDFEETDDSINPIYYLQYDRQIHISDYNKTLIHPFWGVIFSFACRYFVINIPYNQYLWMVFQGKEINISFQELTYKYDYYRSANDIYFHWFHTKYKIYETYFYYIVIRLIFFTL